MAHWGIFLLYSLLSPTLSGAVTQHQSIFGLHLHIKLCVCVISCFRCVWLCNSMDYSPPGSSVCGILQARILVWVAISSSRASSWPRDRTQISCSAGRFFTTEPPGKPHSKLTHLEIKLRVFSPLSNWLPGVPNMAVSVTWGTSDCVAGLDELGCWGSAHLATIHAGFHSMLHESAAFTGRASLSACWLPVLSQHRESSVLALGWPSCSLGTCFLGRSGNPGMD